MDLSYFQKINNTYQSSSKQETDLFLLNRHVDDCFADTIDYHIVERNGEPFELLIIKDTDNNTHKKKIKSKHSSPFNLGDYIKWNGQMWIVMSLDPDDKTYHSGYMYLCTLLLYWQNKNGEIVERWGYSEDFTKYSSGVEDGKVVTIGDNQYGVTLPVDDETKHLKRDKRFIVDFEDVDVPDAYTLTNRKVLLNDDGYFGRGSLLNLTLSYDAFNSNTDKLIELPDGRKVWICDYISSDEPTTPPLPDKSDILSKIEGNKKLKLGYRRTYVAQFFDKNNESVDIPLDFSWKVICDFSDVLEQEIDGNSISFLIDDEDYLDEKFVLQALIGGQAVDSMTITVSGVYGT